MSPTKGFFSPAVERADHEARQLNPLFVPLYMRYWRAFRDGNKTTEFRTYGPRWNERTCLVGRRVTLSAGYGKKHRIFARVAGFEHVGTEARIHLDVYPNIRPEARAADFT